MSILAPMNRSSRKKPPEIFTAVIESLSHEGRGITHLNDKTTFLFNALPGETVTFHYTQKRRQIAEGTSIEILTPSPDRVTPVCPHFTVCGGCSLQQLSPDHQRHLKFNAVLEQLHQQGITPKKHLPILTGPDWGYRRKARMGIKFVAQKDKVMVGFRERYSNLITEMQTCSVLDERIGLKIEAIKALIYDLEAKSSIPQIEVAATDDEMGLILRHLETLSESDLNKIKTFAEQHRFKIYLQPKGIDSIHLLVGNDAELHYQIPAFNLTFSFLPAQFTQINETINRKMISQAIQLLDLQPGDRVLDLFCGIGNFTLAIAQQGNPVTGVEGDALAIAQAKKNAALNHLSNTEFHVANLFEDCTILPWARKQYEHLLIDPPRSGAQAILGLVPYWHPRNIVYISCNPATFARDAAILNAQGYTLETVGTLDMFPHTEHTEVMGLFTLK